jgi:hypothetical protein
MSDKQLRYSVGPFRYVKRELLDGADEPLLIKSIGGYDDRINLYEGDWHLFAAAPEMLEALKIGRRAIGEHYAPDECYIIGPLTGNDYIDLVQCPACQFIHMYDAVIAKAEGRQE